jgi:hypothetical protein
MTLRTKLVISFTLLLLAVIAVVGLVASRSIRSILIGQIDQDLQGVVSRGPGPFGDGPPGPRPDDGPFLEPFAVVVTDASGTVIDARPSGFADEPDPLPDVSGLDGEEVWSPFPASTGPSNIGVMWRWRQMGRSWSTPSRCAMSPQRPRR